MLSIDPGEQPHVPPRGTPGDQDRAAGHDDTAARPLMDIVPPQAMANGGTIIRPGAVAWGGSRDAGQRARRRYTSCEAVERALTGVVANPAEFPGLVAKLATARLWVPLPDRRRPFTDGAAVRLPLIGYQHAEFVPCFTSVQRLTAWAEPDGTAARRAGDERAVPHVVVPAAGLAGRLPAGIGLAVNPDCAPGLPVYPECVPFLARLAEPWYGAAAVPGGLIGHPPGEPATLLARTRAELGALSCVRRAAAGWLAVHGDGDGLVVAVTLDDPSDRSARTAAVDAVERAAAAVPLHVPFRLDVTFPGEAPGPDPVGDWIGDNVRPFFVRA